MAMGYLHNRSNSTIPINPQSRRYPAPQKPTLALRLMKGMGITLEKTGRKDAKGLDEKREVGFDHSDKPVLSFAKMFRKHGGKGYSPDAAQKYYDSKLPTPSSHPSTTNLLLGSESPVVRVEPIIAAEEGPSTPVSAVPTEPRVLERAFTLPPRTSSLEQPVMGMPPRSMTLPITPSSKRVSTDGNLLRENRPLGGNRSQLPGIEEDLPPMPPLPSHLAR